MSILIKLKQFAENLIRVGYKFTLSHKVKKIKQKGIISVLFILNDISKWKTEALYTQMLIHPRFKPIIGITIRNGESPLSYSRKVLDIVSFLEQKKYKYVELSKTFTPSPDIVIYTEPYGSSVPKEQSIFHYLSSLFINVNYSCHTTHLDIDYNARLHKFAWIDCYENIEAIKEAHKFIGYKRKSIRLTGLPMFDNLLLPSLKNPWKVQDRIKKKIIWAPHHSIGGFNDETIIYSNFLEMFEMMFDIANKYKDEIQIAFKPHPLLRGKLDKIWGVNATSMYYERWDNLDNGQLEQGQYVDLFKTSDALIHDSSSFMVEYQFLDKPTLFIVKNEENIIKDLNEFGRKAFYSQQLIRDITDIEIFINDIIKGVDKCKDIRNNFIDSIFPCKGILASNNIINSILN